MSALAVAQIILAAASLGLLVLRLSQIRADLSRLGSEEQLLLNQLADTQSDLYRISVLLRDTFILTGGERLEAAGELVQVLKRIGNQSIQIPGWVTPEVRKRLEATEEDRREFVELTRAITSLEENARQAIGPAFLYRRLSPMREKFTDTAREIAALLRPLEQQRNQAIVSSIDGIQAFVIRVLAAAAFIGLAVAGVSLWWFHRFEKEREIHTRHLQEAEEGLRALSQRLVESQETERKQLSRELHDEVGQILTALRVQIGQIDPAGAASQVHLQSASDLADRSLRSIREMARGLRPAMLDDLGLAPALRWLARDFARHSILDVDVQIEGELTDLSDPIRTCLYRVVQEALTNCVKHSKSATARVRLRESPDAVFLSVEDDGVGFASHHQGGIGLLGMRERVEELGGDFTVKSSPGQGTIIRTELPKTKVETSA